MNKDVTDKLLKDHQPEAIRTRLRQPPKTQNISNAILGAIDGCVTTFAIVSGAVGAGLSAPIALILGFSNLLADGFSMAVSNYESTMAGVDYVENIKKHEEQHIEQIPAGEREEIRQIFQQKGFENEVLESIVDTITSDRELWVNTMLMEEHGLQKTAPGPWKAALVTFTAFVALGAMPLAPLIVQPMDMHDQFFYSGCMAGLVFFTIGMFKSVVFGKPVIQAGLSTLFTGGLAASIAFLTGYLLRTTFALV